MSEKLFSTLALQKRAEILQRIFKQLLYLVCRLKPSPYFTLFLLLDAYSYSSPQVAWIHTAVSPSKLYEMLLIFRVSLLPSDLNRSHSRNFSTDFGLINEALRAFTNSRYLETYEPWFPIFLSTKRVNSDFWTWMYNFSNYILYWQKKPPYLRWRTCALLLLNTHSGSSINTIMDKHIAHSDAQPRRTHILAERNGAHLVSSSTRDERSARTFLSYFTTSTGMVDISVSSPVWSIDRRNSTHMWRCLFPRDDSNVKSPSNGKSCI